MKPIDCVRAEKQSVGSTFPYYSNIFNKDQAKSTSIFNELVNNWFNIMKRYTLKQNLSREKVIITHLWVDKNHICDNYESVESCFPKSEKYEG